MPNAVLDTLHEGVPTWLEPSLTDWLWDFIGRGRNPNMDFVNGFEMAARLKPALSRANGWASARSDLLERIEENHIFAFDVVDFALFSLKDRRPGDQIEIAHRIATALHAAGSVWAVAPRQDQDGQEEGFRLVRRELAEARSAVRRLSETPGRAGDFLAASWSSVAGRDPHFGDAYDKAVKAVEAAMHPVVVPQNAKATLGTMRANIRDKPEKWAFRPPVSYDLLMTMSGNLWTGHLRHGTDERFGTAEDARTDHTVEEAEAALHLAIALVGFFQGGCVSRA